MNQGYEFKKKSISGVYEITPFSSSDFRGSGVKDFSEEVFKGHDIDFQAKEILTITSKKGVLRGLHFQRVKEQAKLIRCIRGKLWCVVVDIRSGSATFKQWIEVDVNEGMEVYVPAGCAVGTLALHDSLMLCAYNEKYYGEYDDGIRWDDKDIGVKWPLEQIGGSPIISEKDKRLGSFAAAFPVNQERL